MYYVQRGWRNVGYRLGRANAANKAAVSRMTGISQNAQITADFLDIYEPQHNQESDIYAPDYVAKLNQMIVSFRLDIIGMQGKLKLGQQRSDQDQTGVFEALNASPRAADKALASFMESWEFANKQG